MDTTYFKNEDKLNYLIDRFEHAIYLIGGENSRYCLRQIYAKSDERSLDKAESQKEEIKKTFQQAYNLSKEMLKQYPSNLELKIILEAIQRKVNHYNLYWELNLDMGETNV